MTLPNQGLIEFCNPEEHEQVDYMPGVLRRASTLASDNPASNLFYSESHPVGTRNDQNRTRVIKLYTDYQRNKDLMIDTPRLGFFGHGGLCEFDEDAEHKYKELTGVISGTAYVPSALGITKEIARWILAPAIQTGNLSILDDPFIYPSNFLFQEDKIGKRFEKILSLKEGWDGPRSLRINPEIATFAKGVLNILLDHGAPEASVIPISDGSIQIEWHWADQVIELHCVNDNTIDATRYHVDSDPDDLDENLLEGDLSSIDLSTIMQWLEEMNSAILTKRTSLSHGATKR